VSRLEVLTYGHSDRLQYKDSQFVPYAAMEGDRNQGEWTVERMPQQCFVKQSNQLEDGATLVTAMSVTQSRVRHDFLEFDLVAYDAGYHPYHRLADEVVY